jgi:hypothetical protein
VRTFLLLIFILTICRGKSERCEGSLTLRNTRLVEQTNARVHYCRPNLHPTAVVMRHCHLEREELLGVASQLDYLVENLAHIASDLAAVALVRQAKVDFDKCL